MGLFNKSPKEAILCDICNNDVKARDGKLVAKDGVVCRTCYAMSGITRLFGNLSDVSIEDLRSGVDRSKELAIIQLEKEEESSKALSTFKPSRQINVLHIDDASRKWYILEPKVSGFLNVDLIPGAVHSFDEIDSVEILEDDASVVTTKKSGLGRAVVGGALFGGAGAVVGAVTGKERSTTKSMVGSLVVRVQLKGGAGSESIALLSSPTPTNSSQYTHWLEVAKNMLSALEGLMPEDTMPAPAAALSPADEIKKFKELLDAGVLTQEEFDIKKKQLLGI